MLFSAGCLIEAPARKWRWRLLERLPSQRRCSNPERSRVLIKIAVVPQSDIHLSSSQMCRCALVERGKRTKSPSTASTSTRRFFTQPGILRWDLRPTICQCYWSFVKPKSLLLIYSQCFVIDSFSSPIIAGKHYRCRGHEQSLPLPGSDQAQHYWRWKQRVNMLFSHFQENY